MVGKLACGKALMGARRGCRDRPTARQGIVGLKIATRLSAGLIRAI